MKEKLKKSINYQFEDIERQEFDNIKEAITNRMQLVTYNPAKRTGSSMMRARPVWCTWCNRSMTRRSVGAQCQVPSVAANEKFSGATPGHSNRLTRVYHRFI